MENQLIVFIHEGARSSHIEVPAKKHVSFALSCLLVFLLGACSIDVAQLAVSTTSSAPNEAPLPAASNLPWAALQLSGRLVYTALPQTDDATIQELRVLDSVTGETETILATTGHDWIYYAAVSPDGTQAVLSYVPSSQSGSGAETSLYILPLDGSQPLKKLVTPPTPADRIIQVEWSPDGEYIYYVQYNRSENPEQFYQIYHLFRMRYPNGQPEKILDLAFWPRLSSDSSKIVYISLDPDTGIHELVMTNADGSGPQVIGLSGSAAPEIIDAPIFTPDGNTIMFSAPSPEQVHQPNWLDVLSGVFVVKAHNVPSDWWSVPITGGDPVRLTQIQVPGLFADVSPDQRYFVSAGSNGIFIMNPDGSNLTYLISPPGGITGTVRWIP